MNITNLILSTILSAWNTQFRWILSRYILGQWYPLNFRYEKLTLQITQFSTNSHKFSTNSESFQPLRTHNNERKGKISCQHATFTCWFLASPFWKPPLSCQFLIKSQHYHQPYKTSNPRPGLINPRQNDNNKKLMRHHCTATPTSPISLQGQN